LTNTIRAKRLRTSGEYLFVFLFMMLHPTHELEPPANPAWFEIASEPAAPDEIWYEVPDKTIYSIAEDYRLDMERLER